MKLTEIKNENFHRQLKSEKIKEMAMILLLQLNDKIVYDIVCCETNEQLQARIKELDSNVRGFSYIAVTDKFSFVEYKRKMILNK